MPSILRPEKKTLEDNIVFLNKELESYKDHENDDNEENDENSGGEQGGEKDNEDKDKEDNDEFSNSNSVIRNLFIL